MEKREERLGCDVTLHLPEDGDLFYVPSMPRRQRNLGPEESDLRLSEEPPV